MDLAHMVAAASILVVLVGLGYSVMENGEEIPRFQKNFTGETECPELELGLEKFEYRSATISQLEGKEPAGEMIVKWEFEDSKDTRTLRVRTAIEEGQNQVRATNGLAKMDWQVENITVKPERCRNTSFHYSP